MSEQLIALHLTGGPPWGFRLRGGPLHGLRVSRVRRRSPASAAGLREGDRLVSVNAASAAGLTYAAVMEVAERSRRLDLEVTRIVSAQRIMFAYADYEDEEDEEEEEEEEEEVMDEPEEAVIEMVVEELQLPSVPEETVVPADPEVSSVPLSRLVTEAAPEPPPPRPSTKKYADSAYFDATASAYPTVEEQKEMAKKVAETLTAVQNRGSRGATMFERRRERAAKYTLEGPDPDELGVVGVGHVAFVGQTDEPPQMIDTSVGPPIEGRDESGITKLPIPPPPPTPPPPPGAPFRFATCVPKLPPPKTVAEFVERERSSAPKLTHRDYDPKKAFDIAAALHSSGGKAAAMFHKRRQRAHKYTIESEGTAGATQPQQLQQRQQQQQPQFHQMQLQQQRPLEHNDASLAAKIQRLQESLDSPRVWQQQQQQPALAGVSDM